MGRNLASYSLSATFQEEPDGVERQGGVLVVAGEGGGDVDVAEVVAVTTLQGDGALGRPAPDPGADDAGLRAGEDDVRLLGVVADGRGVEVVLVPVGDEEDVRRDPRGVDHRRDGAGDAPELRGIVGEVGVDHHGDALRRLEEVAALAKPDAGGAVGRNGEGGDLGFELPVVGLVGGHGVPPFAMDHGLWAMRDRRSGLRGLRRRG
jgi:hypothetical protein